MVLELMSWSKAVLSEGQYSQFEIFSVCIQTYQSNQDQWASSVFAHHEEDLGIPPDDKFRPISVIGFLVLSDITEAQTNYSEPRINHRRDSDDNYRGLVLPLWPKWPQFWCYISVLSHVCFGALSMGIFRCYCSKGFCADTEMKSHHSTTVLMKSQ